MELNNIEKSKKLLPEDPEAATAAPTEGADAASPPSSQPTEEVEPSTTSSRPRRVSSVKIAAGGAIDRIEFRYEDGSKWSLGGPGGDKASPNHGGWMILVSAVNGELIAVFEKEEFADSSVKALKQRLAQQIGVSRFRLRLLQDNCLLNDDQTLTLGVVQLVKVEFLPPDMEQDRDIMVACRSGDDKLLQQHLNQPRSPNFEDANAKTPLFEAASNGSLQCVLLLLEAGAEKDKGRTDIGATPLSIAAQNGHLEVVRFLVESGANKDQGRTDIGAMPLFIASAKGHLEVVRFLVEEFLHWSWLKTSTWKRSATKAFHSGGM
eukprot:symbB.v1.2.021061.t1/scaffold1799.1/size100815/6